LILCQADLNLCFMCLIQMSIWTWETRIMQSVPLWWHVTWLWRIIMQWNSVQLKKGCSLWEWINHQWSLTHHSSLGIFKSSHHNAQAMNLPLLNLKTCFRCLHIFDFYSLTASVTTLTFFCHTAVQICIWKTMNWTQLQWANGNITCWKSTGLIS